MIFVEKASSSPMDFRGISLGVPEYADFFQFDLADVEISNVDMSESSLSCSFVAGKFEHVKFDRADFDACRLNRAIFTDCSFDGARLVIVADGARVQKCSFREARFEGRGGLEYGGRRTVFIDCDFSDSAFRAVEFRASRFINCVFAGARFDRVDLRGAKFEGDAPLQEQLIRCVG